MSIETVRTETPPSVRIRFIFYNCLFETPEVETVTYLRFFLMRSSLLLLQGYQR